MGIVNKVESSLARSVLCGVFVNAGREISVASTKAFSGQVVALILTTLFFILYTVKYLNDQTLVNKIRNLA